ncbi:MAG: hypothetical protein ACFB0B_12075 [Thermonemataceae bacterium]
MLNDILQAIQMLERIEQPSAEVQETLTFLKQRVRQKTKENLLDLMSVGEAIGYEELKSSLQEMLFFMEKIAEKQ